MGNDFCIVSVGHHYRISEADGKARTTFHVCQQDIAGICTWIKYSGRHPLGAGKRKPVAVLS